MSFSSFAELYDHINGRAYQPYSEYLVSAFEKADITVREVLDLGCGTGGICAELADKGFDMVALDISPEMLNFARERNFGKNTLLLCQDMREFELYGTVQAVYSSFDCINYLTEDGDLQTVFELVHNYLERGGVFAFDVNSEYRYTNVFDGKSFVYEVEDDMAVWRNAFSSEDKICVFDIDIFSMLKNGKYIRTSENQFQRLYSRSEIIEAAKGFELVEVSGGKGFDGCEKAEKEYYIFKRI